MANTKYKPEYKEQAKKLCALGAIDEDIADFFEVDVRTIYNWKNEFPEFKEALQEAKDLVDAKVVRSLFERATGYSCTDTKFASHEGKITDVQEYTRHYPPDTTAQIFWLKNRKPDEWRDTTHHEHKGQVTIDKLEAGRKRAQERAKPNE